MAEPARERAELARMAYALCLEIENLPASEQQTRCSVAASQLLTALGVERVRPVTRAALSGGSPSNCQHEPPYPGARTVVCSIRDPNTVAHLASDRCDREEPHPIAECGEFAGGSPEWAAQIAESFVGSGNEERDDCAKAIAAQIRFRGGSAPGGPSLQRPVAEIVHDMVSRYPGGSPTEGHEK